MKKKVRLEKFREELAIVLPWSATPLQNHGTFTRPGSEDAYHNGYTDIGLR